MGKRLIVAEKPSVGRDIANVLNCRKNEPGCRIGDTDVVTWAVGHLVGLCYPDEMDARYTEWKMEDLPIFPDPFQLKVLESGEKQFEIVKAWMNAPEIDTIVCATDAGREGELIFRYIYQMAGCTKPVERLWISSLTFCAIKEGFENLKPSADYDDLYQSARCRSEADWLIGMNGSRAYAVQNDMRRLSIGRVLSPTLSILVQRELERRNFVPEEYCEVVVSFGNYNGKLLHSEDGEKEEWTQFPIVQKPELERFIKQHSNTGTVSYTRYEEEQQPPQLLYDLTSLQRDANRMYGMSSQWTLDTAQSLYERHKAITYPRTDSRYISADIRSTLAKRLESLQDGDLQEFASRALRSEKDLFGRFIFNQGVTDHHAIIPTGEAKGMGSWTKQEKQIYDLISRRFIAMFLPDRQVIHQQIRTLVDDRTFLSTGEKEISAGWSAVDVSKINHIQELPTVKEGDQVPVTNMRLRTDQTKAPAPHTEASLLAAMEHAGTIVSDENSDDKETEFGIGTPATRAATIEKMLEKEMVVRKGRALMPTEYGIKLVSILPEILQSPEMTGTWEARLAHISKGEEDPEAFMADIRSLTKDVIFYAAQLGDTGIKDANSVGSCPLCGSAVREYENAYYCTNKACGFRKIYKAVKGFHPTLTSITMRELLANGTAKTEKGIYKLIKESPYMSFEYAPVKSPDYQRLFGLLDEYGLEPVDKVRISGGLWIEGSHHDELIKDFLRECKSFGCDFAYVDDSKALKHKSGWYHRVDPKNMPEYEKASQEKPRQAVGRLSDAASSEITTTKQTDEPADVMQLIKDSGFEYVDKRPSGGSLWVIAGEQEGKALADRCKALGLPMMFTERGGRASKKRPAWYSL